MSDWLPQHRTYISVHGSSKVYTLLRRITFTKTEVSNSLSK